MTQSQPERQETAGLTMIDLLNLPDSERQLVNWMRRNVGCTLADVAAQLHQDEATALALLKTLLSKGYIYSAEEAGQPSYHVRIVSAQRYRSPQLHRFIDDIA